MKYLFVFLFLSMSISTFAQSDFDKSKDSENNAIVYKGQITFEDLKAEPTFNWFTEGTEQYKPDAREVEFLKKNLKSYRLVVLLGTWCEDSQNLIPKLNKVLQTAEFPMSQYQMFGVNREKAAKYAEKQMYKLEKVPTIIVFKGNKEVGRIVETVEKSVENGLVKIINGGKSLD
jgi:thiol-disulfide isomerase/thioredoxin